MAEQTEMDKIVPMLLLFKLIADRNETLSKKDEKLEAIKNELAQQNEDYAELLDELDDKQQDLEDEILEKIQTPSAMSIFLKNILLIENLFNGYYSKELRDKQQKGRALAVGITDKEKVKVKLEYNANTFGDIYNTAKQQMEIFNKFCVRMSSILKQNNIKLKYPAKANLKKAPRSFYKAYFWYTGDKSHNKLSDLLRTSFVFNTFKDLYKAYNLISQNCKIVRVKDRFNAKVMPFGYRDCLLNVRCPGIKGSTPLICEVQLHHKAFYDNKKTSHKIYKTARLFEAKKDKKKINFAYQSAKQYYGQIVGDKKYVAEPNYDEADDDDEELVAKLQYAQEQIENGVSVDELIAEFQQGDYEQYDDFSDYESMDSDYDDDDDQEWDDESEYEDDFDYDEYDEEKEDFGDDDYGDYDDDYDDGDDDNKDDNSDSDDGDDQGGDDDQGDYEDDFDY
eukprot:223855_1